MSGVYDHNSPPLDEEVYEETGEGRHIAVLNKAHFEKHIEDGYGYSLTIEKEVTDVEGVYRMILTTPADHDVRIRSRSVTTGGGMRYKPYIGGTWTLGAPRSGIRNLNGPSGIVSPVGLYEVDTLTDVGEDIDVLRTPDAQGSSQNSVTYGADGAVRILSRSTEYLLEFDNIQSNNNDIWFIYNLTMTAVPDAP